MSAVPKFSPKGTPTVSPKMSPAREPKSLTQKPEQEKKPEKSQGEKAPSQPPKAAATSEHQTTCPLCKVELNFGSKEPQNYNSCTECKTTVCNQCGFNPMPMGEVKEWLCLNCQMKRAVEASEPLGQPTMKSQTSPSKVPLPAAVQSKDSTKPTTPQKKDSPGSAVQKKETSEPESQRKQSTPSLQSGKPESATLPLKQASPAPDRKAPQERQKTGPTKPPDQENQTKRKGSTTAGTQQDSGGLFGLGVGKTQPDAAKPADSVTGKMFGFGSSIFSSASTLITSAVDQPKTTPPVSPKMSPAKDIKSLDNKKLEPQNKEEHIRQTRTTPTGPVKDDKAPSESTKTTEASKVPVKAGQSACPLCNVKLNMESKDLPNYSTCTECKNIVCNQCGFTPMPLGEVKEWLCLNCQMKRAVEATESPVPPTMKSKTTPGKVPSSAAAQVIDSSKPTTTQKKEISEPVISQRKQSTTSVQSGKSEADSLQVKQDSPAPDKKASQEKQKTGPAERKQSNTPAATQQDSGGLFGKVVGKTQPDAAKPADSVSGKMFGFGSSIFSSASTLITSAVDQPKTTPPVSPKMSPARDIKSTSAQKLEQEKKTELTQRTDTLPSGQVKLDKTQLGPPKASEASKGPVKPSQSTCPLCKAELNMGSKDLPNYSTCTECKNTVCKQCGFNPSPNDTVVKEWLCLNCQMQRALGVTQPPGVASATSQIPLNPQKKDTLGPTESEKKEPLAQQSPQRKPSVTAQPDTAESAKEPEGLKQPSPVPSQKRPQEPRKTSGPNKIPDQTRLTERKPSNASEVTPQESGSFFGFGASKTQPDAAKPAESVTGKMFGFGSSIFSSASNLMTSTVDQPKTTPPVSPKMSPAREIKSPAANKKEQQKIAEQPKPTPQSAQVKVDKVPSEATSLSQATVKQGQSTCPLCKFELNIGSKDLPNYNTCTECKNTVCKQCGFNPMPNVSEVKEWLCLTCQMQRALTASESLEPPLMKPKVSPNKVSAPAAAQKDTTENLKKEEIISTPQTAVPDKKQDSPKPGAQQQREETKTPYQMDITQTTTTDSPLAKDSQDTILAPTKDVKTGLPTTIEIPTSNAPPREETTAVISDINKTLPDQFHPVKTDTETSLQKKKDITPPSSPAAKKVPEKKEEKAVIVQKLADQSATDNEKVQPQQTMSKEPTAVEKSLAKSAPPSTQPEESRGFFGFGSPKSQRATSKTTEAVTGKMLGFGSSIFSSASTLITSAVQEESRTTPPSSRKMSAPAQVSDRMSASQKPSPPVSPKMTSAKEKKPSAAGIPNLEKIPDQLQQTKAPPSGQAKGDNDQSETFQAAPKVDQLSCPLCKAELNMDSKDPSYNTCTECKSTVCSKCGFSPMPNATEVKEWLCLNCQMKRALGASEPQGLPMIKPQPSPSKEISATTQKLETPMSTSQDDISTPAAPLNEVVNGAPTKETESPASVAPTKKVVPSTTPLSDKTVPSTITKTDVSLASPKPSEPTTKGQPGAPQQQPPKAVTSTAKSAPQTDPQAGHPIPQKPPQTVTSVTTPASTPDPQVGKLPLKQPAKAGTSPAKSAPPPAQPAKQESGGFFGFGGPKTQPSAAKSAESVTGKMFGFGSSFLSSASTLITTAVQDEPKTTPPTPRKMSIAAHVSPKTTPPASPKTLPAKDIKPSAVQKPLEKKPGELPQEKTPSTEQAKVEKAPTELTQTDTQGAPKSDPSICPLCKVELNMGSKDPPNYNTCTECKANVCNQCGFNPMPNVAEVKEWLCLNCQMHRALGASEPTGRPVAKPQPSPGKVFTPGSEQTDIQQEVKKEKSAESVAVKKDVPQATPHRQETPKAETPLPTAVKRTDTPGQGSVQKTQVLSGTEQRQGQGVAGQQPQQPQQPVGKSPQVQPPQTTMPVTKGGPAKQGVGKPPQQPLRSATPPAKSAPPPAQPAKQESGGLFGFGGPKTQPAAAKPAAAKPAAAKPAESLCIYIDNHGCSG
uniref:protein piccolo-like n=1 Tax=Semicossyphus pulcher TaxID=241346 RepID=UPI0037E844C6